MFTFDRKPSTPSPGPPTAKPAPASPAVAAPVNTLWFRLATSAPARPGGWTVGAAEDPAEREADRMADAALRSAGSSPAAGAPGSMHAGDPGSAASAHARSMDPTVKAGPGNGGGSPLPAGVRASLEPRFGASFEDVRVHVDGESTRMSRALGAQAFTAGPDIYFGPGKSPSDTALLSHELAHVVQQRGSSAEGARVVRRQPAPAAPTPQDVQTLTNELTSLIARATWPAIRAVQYPAISAAAIKRANERRAGTTTDLTGIGSVAATTRFATAVKAVQAQWSKLSASERARKLFNAANDELKSAKVFPMKGFSVASITARGQFDPSTWMMTLQDTLINNPAPSNGEIADVENVTLHEARHCEQHYLAARFEGSKPGKLAADVMKSQGIPGDVAIAAVQREKLGTDRLAGAEQTRAESMFNSLIRDGATHGATTANTETQINELDTKRSDAQAKLSALQASATAQTYADAIAARDALKAQKKAVEDAYAKYRAIPHEADAHEVGDTAEVAFKALP